MAAGLLDNVGMVRESIVSMLSAALNDDRLAAEYLLLTLVSRVYVSI